MDSALIKRNGVHYTPPALAGFLASEMKRVGGRKSPLRILDPACGDGQLLEAAIQALPDSRIEVYGLEKDPQAAERTRRRLAGLGCDPAAICCGDFLEHLEDLPAVDWAICNPPYVRTQQLGGARARELALRFGLSGRIDLYQVFTVGLSRVLRAGGVLGLLTSNRFLTVRAGRTMREQLASDFQLKAIFDLGETRLFTAAVLPAVVVGVKRAAADGPPGKCHFTRISRQTGSNAERQPQLTAEQLLRRIARRRDGTVSSGTACHRIECGDLQPFNGRPGDPWQLRTDLTDSWLQTLSKHQVTCFGEVARVKVGIKTTADQVFIGEQWPDDIRKTGLVHPLLTHRDAGRWFTRSATTAKTVLYPYDIKASGRVPIDLADYPAVRQYLRQHRPRLEGRKYLLDAGRKWYEMWVPHQPVSWRNPKIVWPDISDQPRFFLDGQSRMVNGDCYWMELRAEVDPDWLYLILAVANSSLVTRFYDLRFHNKLFAGRRRFMTQYVRQFPLPALETPVARRIVATVKRILRRRQAGPTVNRRLEGLVQAAFGFSIQKRAGRSVGPDQGDWEAEASTRMPKTS